MRNILLVLAAVLGLSVVGLPASQAQSPVAGTSKAAALPAFAVADPASVPVLDRTARVNARVDGTGVMANHPAIVMPPAGLKPKLIGSGHNPYGGTSYSTQQIAGGFPGCSTAVATRSSTGAQYVYSAGHCVLDETTAQPAVNPTTGQFWSPYDSACFTCQPKFGANGYGGASWGPAGDHMFIRAGIAPTLYREIRTYRTTDGGVFTATGTGNPIQNETGSCACGFSKRIIHGFVSFPCLCTERFGTSPTIGNLAIMQIDYPTEGCPILGDSGSPILGGHDVIGTATAVNHDAAHCWIWFSRAGNDMQPQGQFLAPAPPA